VRYRSAKPVKYAILGLVFIVVLALAIAPFSKRLIEQWSRSDVEARSRLVYNAVQYPVMRAIADNDASRLSLIFENVALDDRIPPSACAIRAAA
jgi:trehalose 6-phosphate synthase